MDGQPIDAPDGATNLLATNTENCGPRRGDDDDAYYPGVGESLSTGRLSYSRRGFLPSHLCVTRTHARAIQRTTTTQVKHLPYTHA
jgi:hypothetical protein